MRRERKPSALYAFDEILFGELYNPDAAAYFTFVDYC